MEKVIKYQLYCVVEQVWHTVIREEGDEVPTTCPIDTSHGIQAGSLSVVGELEKSTIKTERKVPKGGTKVSNEGFAFTATAGQATTHDYKFENPIEIASGFMNSVGSHIKDNITLSLVDVDGVAYPAGTVLHTYVRNFPVDLSGKTNIENEAITETSLQHFYVRVIYKSFGGTDVECNCGIIGRI